MREADYLLDMTYDDRMNFCVFKYDPKKVAALGLYSCWGFGYFSVLEIKIKGRGGGGGGSKSAHARIFF